MSVIKIKIRGDIAISQSIDGFVKDLTDFSEPLLMSSKKMLLAIALNFRDEGKTFNEPWPPLSETTIKIKRRLYGQGKSLAIQKPLVRTGKLRKGFGDVISKKNLQIYNEMGYAWIHQDGGFATFHGKKIKIPQRMLAKLDNKRLKSLGGTTERWINDRLRVRKLI